MLRSSLNKTKFTSIKKKFIKKKTSFKKTQQIKL